MSLNSNEFIGQVQRLTGHLDHTLSFLRQVEEYIMKWSGGRLDECLEMLDPSQHALAWIFVLNARCYSQIGGNDILTYLTNVQKLVYGTGRQQFGYSPSRYCNVVRKYVEKCIDIKQPLRAIPLCFQAIKQLQPTADFFTPIHAELMKCCILAKNYRVALRVLDKQILDLEGTGTSARDLLLYGYYGGMIYIGLKQFSKAAKMFELSMTVPAVALSAIAVEAYKKYMLINLIQNGHVPRNYPKHTPNILQRTLKNCVTPYNEFATAFSTYDLQAVNKVVNQHQKEFRKDNNFGLVCQAIVAVNQMSVVRLTRTYFTLSLGEIAKSTGMSSSSQVESTLVNMINDGIVKARVDQKNGMVSFLETNENYDDRSMLLNLNRKIQGAATLTRKLNNLDETIKLSTAYLFRLLSERGGDRELAGGAGM